MLKWRSAPCARLFQILRHNLRDGVLLRSNQPVDVYEIENARLVLLTIVFQVLVDQPHWRAQLLVRLHRYLHQWVLISAGCLLFPFINTYLRIGLRSSKRAAFLGGLVRKSRRLSSQSRTLRRSSRRSWMPWALSTARPSFSCVTLPFAALAESVFLTKTL